MKLQTFILTVGAVAAFGLGGVNHAQAGEFKLLQNFLNAVSIFGGGESGSGQQTNTTVQIGPIVPMPDPLPTVNPKRPVLLPGPIRPIGPFGPAPFDPTLAK